MHHEILKHIILGLLLVGLLTCASPAFAVTPEVRDDAGFFKSQTVSQANTVIRDIKQKYRKDLVIETLRQPPADKQNLATSSDPKEKQRFFAEWAVERAREQGVNGIYVLITLQPGHIEVAVGNQTRKVFPDKERDKLTQTLLSHFRAKEFDEGLIAGVNQVRSALANQVRTAESPGGARGDGRGTSVPPADRSTGWSMWHWLGLGLAVLVGFWVLRAITRGMSAGGRPTYPDRRPDSGPGSGPAAGGYGPGYGGGGGFMSSVLGGLFGAAAGSWLYDRFVGGAHAAPPPATPVEPSGRESVDTGYAATGGDFDEPTRRDNNDFAGGDYSGGGGDFGGGDFGGGDTSGGDF